MRAFSGWLPLSLALVLGCSPPPPSSPAPAKYPGEMGSTPDTSAGEKEAHDGTSAHAESAEGARSEAIDAAEDNRRLPHLSRFFAALHELARGQRSSHVRILWLGDSHTAGDFLTDQVRRDLTRIVPSGGPGFVTLGQKGQRHGALTFERSGSWKRQPRDPATQIPLSDDTLGYGGVRTLPQSGAGARVTPKSARVKQAELAYRLRPGDSLEVRFGDSYRRLTASGQFPRIERTSFSLPPSDERSPFVVRHLGGSPELFGLDLTTREPGLILDTVGINGARMRTPLAWSQETFVNEVRLRQPDLVVVMYGTNEVFDRRDPKVYEEDALELLTRVRAGAPEVDCWIIGPPDARTAAGESQPRVALITEAQARAAERAGCAFTSLFELMGGPGSFDAWAKASPPLARPDHIHLTVQGYEELGRRLSELLLRSIALPEVPSEDHP